MSRRTVSRRTAAVLAGAAALAVLAAPAAARPWPHPVPPPARQDHLTISVTGEGATADGLLPGGRTYTLDCHPAGGSHPDALAACDAVDRADQGRRDPWQPVPEGAVCAQIHGGPATARVTGVWRGTRVDARFDRTDGCEIARWDALVPALPGPEA
ncbi:SSI family serine proteinase inhibitor [Streptomyces desertarenae]|uniref:SSI family serine proteinase inhibitor n=1 Tax=Streptomyces desertarenae TaxID=2666184 RepID=A0ABW4PEE4_9ACTN